MFGNPETTAGGTALKFYAHARLETKAISQIKNGENVIGNRVRVKVVKNKHSAPFKIAEFDLVFGQGVDVFGELLDYALQANLIKKSGAWFKVEGENIAQGRHNAIKYLMDNPLGEEIKEQFINSFRKDEEDAEEA
jgi:recombination protein RecA